MWRLEVVETTHHTHSGHAKKALIPDYAQKPMYTLYEDCWGEVPLEGVVQLGGQPTISRITDMTAALPYSDPQVQSFELLK